MSIWHTRVLHVPRLPSKPASNVGGLVIHYTGLNWLDSTIAMTRNNLCIILIFLVFHILKLQFCTIQNVHVINCTNRRTPTLGLMHILVHGKYPDM